MTDIRCTAMICKEKVPFPRPIGNTKYYYKGEQCKNNVSLATGELLLCSDCLGRYNGGLGDPRADVSAFTNWHGWFHNVHEESHVEGGKWWRKMISASLR